MTDLRNFFESEYPGKKAVFENIIKPVFSKAKDTTLTENQILTDAERGQIKSFSVIAQVRGGFPVTFADVELQDSVVLKHSRVNIQNCVRRMMGDNSNAIIFFHFSTNKKEWRVSYVHKNESLKDSTSAKRYTYLCGPDYACRTIAERFETLRGLSVIKDDDLLAAFSVSPLSDEFFEGYREIYAELVEYISGKKFVKKGGKFVEATTKDASPVFTEAFKGDDKAVRDYVKKMMGRLVFLYFLQKKGWLGVPENEKWGNGDKNFIYNLFRNAGEDVKNDFLEKALEPLFFSTLNTDRGAKAFAPEVLCDIYGKKIRIPYLNGGLFESDELDNKKVKFKKEQFEKLLDFFNEYNFTIDETDPDDQEIGVDPEMLGKIFENLLEDNKDKGAFYTPKEIVQYMCRESLIAYLIDASKQTLDVRSESLGKEELASNDCCLMSNKIRAFVTSKDASQFSEEEKSALLRALKDVKICDPAVGSGAFPMGMMNELYACRVALGESTVAEIENAVAEPAETLHSGKLNDRASKIKKEIVKNNIYGVDIEKGAVDIARLRFWLAIIVDEDEPLPLPNLDYKIMQGNSLLESFEGEDLSNLTKKHVYENGQQDMFGGEDSTITSLTKAIDGFYIPCDHVAKAKIRSQISENVIQLLKERQLPPKVIDDIKKIDLHENSEFFLWHTWFHDVFARPHKEGFDIVIGNPPYGAKISEKEKNLFKKYYEASQTKNGFKGSTDTFSVFVNQGYNLLSKGGNLAFIIPMAVTSSDAMTSLHNMLEKNCVAIKVSSYSNRPKQIFDAACIRTSIFMFIKTLSPNKHIYTTKLQRRRYTDSIKKIIDGLQFVDSKSLKLLGRYAKISTETEKQILEKCFATGMNIKSYEDKNGKPFYYRTSGGRYFNVVSDVPTCSNKEKPFFVNQKFTTLISATLSTTLFWFYCQVYTNGLDLKTPELLSFPLPDLLKISEAMKKQIEDKYDEYKIDIERNVIDHGTFKEYKLRKSKNLIDQLDDLICPLYGLTKDETEFIKNYEIEFRVEEE